MEAATRLAMLGSDLAAAAGHDADGRRRLQATGSIMRMSAEIVKYSSSATMRMAGFVWCSAVGADAPPIGRLRERVGGGVKRRFCERPGHQHHADRTTIGNSAGHGQRWMMGQIERTGVIDSQRPD